MNETINLWITVFSLHCRYQSLDKWRSSNRLMSALY